MSMCVCPPVPRPPVPPSEALCCVCRLEFERQQREELEKLELKR